MRARPPMFVPGVLGKGVLGMAVVLVLAGCGSSTSKTTSGGASTSTAPYSASPTTASSAGQQPLVRTKTDPKLGTIMADASGRTVYTLTDNGQAVACTGPCVAVWPPLALPAGVTTASAGPGVTGLGTAPGPDGTQLVTANNLPLYRFSKDSDEEDAYGEGVSSFGGTWHAVKAA